MPSRRRPGLVRRLAAPLLSSVILLGAGVAFMLVPEKAHNEPCHGSAIGVRLRAEKPEALSHDCHAKSLTDMVFGATVGFAGLALLPTSIVLLRREPPGGLG